MEIPTAQVLKNNNLIDKIVLQSDIAPNIYFFLFFLKTQALTNSLPHNVSSWLHPDVVLDIPIMSS